MHIDLPSILALGLMAVVIFLGWRNNRQPHSSHALIREHARLKSRLSAVEADLKGCATKSDVAALSGKIDALEEHAASSGELTALEGKINVALSKIDAVEKATDRTEEGIKRIEGFFIQKGIAR